jgi:outer membrane protein assembly factor BamB
MKSNRTLIIILAVVLMVLVMAGAVVLTLAGIASREKLVTNALWNSPAHSAVSINITDLTGDKQRDIFVQDNAGIRLLDEQGQVLLEKQFPSPLASTMGDLNGDGLPDIIAYTWDGEGASVAAFTGQDQLLWQARPQELGPPGRATAIDFDNDHRSEVVLGSDDGTLVALSSQGEQLWQYTLPAASPLRGLDDVALPSGRTIAAGLETGEVVVLNGQGVALWRTKASGGLRRLRAFPLGGPQNGRVLVGSVNGELSVYEGDSGQLLWSASLGQAVNEIRPIEVDGDPATTEVLVGGKQGGVWAFSQTGQQLWSARVSDNKVNEIVGLDSSGSGREMVVIGDDSGTVTIFDPNGAYLTSFDGEGSVGRLDSGKLAGKSELLVADSQQLKAYTLTSEQAPFWYSPILGGLLACAVIAGLAYGVASLKPAPTLHVSAAEMSVESLKARRRMLYESIEDLKKLQGRDEVSSEAYLARLKELRLQLADVNESLIKLGEPGKAESFTCPHCGGPLELGTDRCEYCGQTVIV